MYSTFHSDSLYTVSSAYSVKHWLITMMHIYRRGQGPHLAKRWDPRGFSRVAAAFSSYDGDTLVFLPGESQGQRNLAGTIHGIVKELDTTE